MFSALGMRLLEKICVVCPGCWYARRYPDRKLARPLAAFMRICPGCAESRAPVGALPAEAPS